MGGEDGGRTGGAWREDRGRGGGREIITGRGGGRESLAPLSR